MLAGKSFIACLLNLTGLLRYPLMSECPHECPHGLIASAKTRISYKIYLRTATYKSAKSILSILHYHM